MGGAAFLAALLFLHTKKQRTRFTESPLQLKLFYCFELF